MKQNKRIYIICLILAWIISIIGTVIVTNKWTVFIESELNSAPAWTNLIYGVPYLLIILLLLIIALVYKNKR